MTLIRKCRENDQSAAKLLISRILKDEFPKEISAFPLEDLEDISRSYGKVGQAFFVACDGEHIIGTIGVKREDERTALLRRLFVDSKYRRKKIGSQLVEEAIRYCREAGYEELIFKTTSTMKSAIQLCEMKGFIQRARLDLGPVQLVKFALFLKNEPTKLRSKTVSS